MIESGAGAVYEAFVRRKSRAAIWRKPCGIRGTTGRPAGRLAEISAWAAGEKPVPPGPGNPLGTRWMGLSSPGVGLHGTPDAASVGYSASHGCIRMRIPDAEWLFVHVRVGSPVWIIH